ncbi:MAG: toll/interleukin-1 receptor domain-containing protein, partial [Planctomycetota bacterium]
MPEDNSEPRIRVFLCHSSKDKKDVIRIAEALESDTIAVWYDDWKIEFGDAISAKIDEGISRSDYVAVVLTPSSVQSRWVEREWSAAYHKEQRWGDVKVLPLLLRDCELPSLLADRRYVDLRHDRFIANLTKLARWIDNKGKYGGSKSRTERQSTTVAQTGKSSVPRRARRGHAVVSRAHYDVRGAWGSNAGAAEIADEVAGVVAAQAISVFPVALIDTWEYGTRFPFGEVVGEVGRGRALIELTIQKESDLRFYRLVAAIGHHPDYFEFVFAHRVGMTTILETFRRKKLKP